MNLRIDRAPGVRVESLGEGWVAFSALSGETHRLNPEAVAVLDLLAAGPLSEADLCALLATESSADAAEIHTTLRGVWPALEAAGLIRTESANNFG